MKIDKKIVYVKKKSTFESLIETIPQGLNPIVFIEDSKEMWTCGTYFSVGYPSLNVSEESGTVKISLGDSYLTMQTVGEGLSIRKGEGNRIIINSNALTKVDTEEPLKWDSSNKKLLHLESSVIQGSYGQSSNLSNASIFTVPNIIVDKYGHITSASNYNVEIRDYVEQLTPTSQAGNRNILLSYSTNNSMETSQVRKANGLLFNDSTKSLTVEGSTTTNGLVVPKGDINVIDGYIIGNIKGNVEGSATPKIHLSKTPEYGGASTKLYGHVLLEDTLPVTEPDNSSSNDSTNNTSVIAKAASPKMVWNAIQNVKEYVDSSGVKIFGYKNGLKTNIQSTLTFSKDFEVDDQNNLTISWIEI